MVRRKNETHTGSVNYDDQEVVAALHQAGQFALLAGIELAVMTGNKPLIEESLSIYKLYES